MHRSTITKRALLIFAVLLAADVVAQEDVLRPRGRERSAPLPPPQWETPPTTFRTTLRVGADVGGGITFLGQTISGAFPQSPVNVYTSASGWAATVGLRMEVQLSPRFSLGLWGAWTPLRANGLYTDAMAEGAYADPTNGYAIVYKDVALDCTADYSMDAITSGLYAGWNIAWEFHLTLGATLQVPVSPLTIVTTQTIDAGQSFRFWSGSAFSSSVTTTENVSQTISPRFGAEASLCYLIPVFSQFSLVPRVSYLAMFTPLLPERSRADGSKAFSTGAVNYIAAPLHTQCLMLSMGFMINFGGRTSP